MSNELKRLSLAEITKNIDADIQRELLPQKTIIPSDEKNNNALLERQATAESAVNVVMRQKGLADPTLLSAWTRMEIARLLDNLHEDPMGAIKLGGQTLGNGFTSVPTPNP